MFLKSGQYVWIVGAQRSGTTHIAQCIAGHPDTGITIEGKLLYYCLHWIWNNYDPTHIRFDEIVHGVKRRVPQNLDSTQSEAFWDAVSTGLSAGVLRCSTKEQAVHLYHDAVYQALFPNAQIIGDKYNEYLLSLEEVNRCFPESRFIFIHRAPLYSASSMLDAFSDRRWCPEELTDALEKWAMWNEKWLQFRNTIDPSRVFEIAYAEFRKSPYEILGDVFKFLELRENADANAHAAETTFRDDARGGKKFDHVEVSPHVASVARNLGYEIIPAKKLSNDVAH
jgi:hypothetical protein